jgi:hypothetical protein
MEDVLGVPPHTALALAAAITGPVACALSLWFAIRVEHRDTWRYPMLISATLATASILGAFVTGQRLLEAEPDLAAQSMVAAHQDYAARLVLPTVGWWVVAALAGWLNPKTGALKLALPLLLTGFSAVVLVLVILSGDADARSLWTSVTNRF